MSVSLEERMFAQGYVSSSVAAERLGKHVSTVLRKVHEGTFEGVDIDNQKFVSIDSMKNHYGPKASLLLGLHDWSDLGLHA